MCFFGHTQFTCMNADARLFPALGNRPCLGTIDGLARYDGHEFVVYQHDPRDAATFSNSWICSLPEDRSGAIWIGTVHGLNRLSPVTGRIKCYSLHPGSARLKELTVFDVHEARNSTLWV